MTIGTVQATLADPDGNGSPLRTDRRCPAA
ncbi:hypothetical protein SAMN05443575_0801 [Jatrophihabitans endophyticus]|uniref:Uncharacterized protein n=1 Tax=Jatrophihabitans endophyticus TaxID=1206085 RepID=A0A1M5E6A0_9ACTN|nr:hypothetical protein SAMN05443575_0801 [Jatrophihabitans endophyticus]